MSSTLDTAMDATASTHEESIMSLIAHGGRTFKSSPSKYVIHTHTIPLATVMDQQELLPDSQSESYFHGFAAGEQGSPHCPKRSCMYIHADNTRAREKLRKNCPCYEVALENGGLVPLCFMVYLRSLNHNLTGMTRPEDRDWQLEPAEVMFCQTATGLFDNSYPGHIRDKFGITGWNHVNAESLPKIMGGLYWYRKYNSTYKLTNKIREFSARRGIRTAKHVVMQCLHSINSLLVKKMLALAPEIEGYKNMARHTAWAFSELFKDYSSNVQTTGVGLMIEPKSGFYQDCKEFSNLVKSHFHRQKRDDRLVWLNKQYTTKAFGAFFGSELRRLQAWVELEYSGSGSDYTLSPAWIYRATILSQTRGLGYLPESIAYCRRAAFRATVNRDLEEVDPEISHLQYLAVQSRLAAEGIPRGLLSKDRPELLSDEMREKSIEAFSRIELPLKSTASTDTFVKDGGKVEDARLLLRLARLCKWKIPQRDLNTHEIISYVTVERETDSDTDYSRPLFWISYQLILNHWIVRREWTPDDWYEFRDLQGGIYLPGVMDAKIVHISEPGKERNLTKSHSCLAWFLTPGAKLTQAVLAMLPEHRAGLLESGHEWRHQKRISALSDESGFIYDPTTGKVHGEIRHVFKDWTESTDFICKRVGYNHLRGLLDYTEFPRSYGRLILKTIVEPQPVVETAIRTIYDDGTDIMEPVKWSGFIREGFMMGNPITKTILHLVHTSERAIAEEFLKTRGLKFVPNYKFGMFSEPGKLDRKESAREQTQYIRATSRMSGQWR